MTHAHLQRKEACCVSDGASRLYTSTAEHLTAAKRTLCKRICEQKLPESVKDFGGQNFDSLLLPFLIDDADSHTGNESTAANVLERLASSAHACSACWLDMPSGYTCMPIGTCTRCDAPHAVVISTHVFLQLTLIQVPAHFTAFVHTILCLVHADATFQRTI